MRIHTGAGTEAAATRLGARAFTHGSDVAFAPGEYAPQSERGRRLLAHELVHVVQQSQRATSDVQRDLATPPPVVAPAAQPDLTPEQIQSALRFNQQRFDRTRTRLIQDLVGTEPTGVWTEDDVVAIAAIQGEYGLTKDGRVGPDTFRFLDAEVRQEGIPRTDANCLLSFNIRNFGVTDGGTAGGFRNISGHFQMRAQFSRTCGCPDYEYRQFIRGHAIRRPAGGGAPVDLGPSFRRFGSIDAAMAAAKAAQPGLSPQFVGFPGGAWSSAHHYAIFFQGDTPLTSHVLTPALVDAETGRLTDMRSMPPLNQALMLSKPLHFGDYGGLALKLLWALLDIATIWVLVTGLYLWLGRRAAGTDVRLAEIETGGAIGSMV